MRLIRFVSQSLQFLQLFFYAHGWSIKVSKHKKTAATNRDGSFYIGSQDRGITVHERWVRSCECMAARL
ncbi:MAG: hypothetical protein CMM01_15910 [Rhodopirellula sp.]|nr:hypothetical protein [Rhodopirellula sp.]